MPEVETSDWVSVVKLDCEPSYSVVSVVSGPWSSVVGSMTWPEFGVADADGAEVVVVVCIL